MGAWGTSVYANDFAKDIRNCYIDKLRLGKTNEKATKELIEEHHDIIDDIEDGPLFWFALADTQWDYGRLMPEVKEKTIYYLSQFEELTRWKESGSKQMVAWQKTLKILGEKINTPQPLEKHVPKYRLYECSWQLGDVFAYRLTSNYSKLKDFDGKYVFFRKVSESTWGPGHIVPVVEIYKWIGDEIVPIESLCNFSMLPAFYTPAAFHKYPNKKIQYKINLTSESEKAIPKDNLTLLGNLPGNDLIPFPGHNVWMGYSAIGWERGKCMTKFEPYAIDMYLAWQDE